jgi:integrase
MMTRAQKEAAELGYVSENAAKTFRKGLELCWRSLLPERLRADQSLCLGTSVKRTGEVWRIDLESKVTKEKKPHRRRVPERLCPWVTEYVERFRPAIPGAKTHNGFWAAQSGKPMSRSTIRQSLARTSACELGVHLSPHAHRRAAATRWPQVAPGQTDKSRRHLKHQNYRITREHYVIRSGLAGRALLESWSPYRQGLEAEHRQDAASSGT